MGKKNSFAIDIHQLQKILSENHCTIEDELITGSSVEEGDLDEVHLCVMVASDDDSRYYRDGNCTIKVHTDCVLITHGLDEGLDRVVHRYKKIKVLETRPDLSGIIEDLGLV